MPHLAIVSDTHIPSRASEIPPWVAEEMQAADHVIHAGDFDSPEAYERVEELAPGGLTAVTGNMDPTGLSLPKTEVLEFGGQTFVVTHGTGSPAGYEDRVRATVRDATDASDPIAVAGHTHEVLDSTDSAIRLLNPGSATGAAPATETSMMLASVTPDGVDVEILREN